MSTDDSKDTTPTFLGEDWLFNAGWSFRDTPTEDLRDPARLASPRPWDRFLCVLLRAQKGDFAHVGVLSSLVAEEQPHPLFLATMYLSAAIGGTAELVALKNWIDSDWFTQATAAVVLAGDLSVVDTLLQRRRGSGTEIKETMESTISQLLEIEPDRFYDTGLDDDGYDALVRREVTVLVERNGAGSRYALGAPLRPRTLIAKLEAIAKLDRDDLDEASAMLSGVALQLETFTGLPSAGVVVTDQAGNDVVDRSRLNRLVDAAQSWDKKHRPRSGRRMFFGHDVPG